MLVLVLVAALAIGVAECRSAAARGVRFGMRRTASLAAVVLTSCSLLAVRGPDPRGRVDQPPDCTINARAPVVVDGLAALVTLPGVLFLSGDASTANNAISVAATAAGVAFFASAVVGYRREGRCRHAWDVYEAR